MSTIDPANPVTELLNKMRRPTVWRHPVTGHYWPDRGHHHIILERHGWQPGQFTIVSAAAYLTGHRPQWQPHIKRRSTDE